MFASGEADQSLLVPVFERRSVVDDISFGGESFDFCLETLDRLLSRFKECRISVSFTKSMFVQPTVDLLSHAVSREGLRADAKKLNAITELSFPKTKKGVQPFLGALNYYSRFIQDFAVYGTALYQMREEDFGPGGDISTAKRSFTALQAKVADAPVLRHFDRAKVVHGMLFANDWALSTTLMQEHDGVMHPVCFCGRVLKDNEANYLPAEKEVLALLLLLKTCYTQLAGRTINAYTRFSTLGWINTSKTLFGRSTQFAVMLSPWHLVVHRVNEDDSAFAQLLHSTITNFVEQHTALQRVAQPSKRSPMVRMDPALLYARLPNDHRGFVLSFDSSAKTPKHRGYGRCAWILWRLPDWKIEIAASAYLESTTVNQAEYMGMNEGLRPAQAYGGRRWRLETRNPTISRGDRMPEGVAFDSAEHTPKARCEISIRQIPPRHPSIQRFGGLAGSRDVGVKGSQNNINRGVEEQAGTTKPNSRSHLRVRFAGTHDEDSEALPVEPEPPDRPNDVTTESSHVENGETSPRAAERPPSAEDMRDPLEVQEEWRRRVDRVQGEELRWANLKSVLKGESMSLGYKAAGEAWKMADRFVLSDDGLPYLLGEDCRWGKDRVNETVLRLVVSTTMVQEVLQSCRDSLEGGHQGIVRTFHRVKAGYYWIGLYADVERHARSCPDCSSSKSRPQLRGYSPGKIGAERPLQIVSMDFVTPLPKSRRGNTALLLFQCAFTGFVMAKAMSDTSAQYVAQTSEECVYRRFGAPSLVGHDRDPRLMSDVFQAFAVMMQSRSRATLSYRPQANGQQERSVKTVMQSVRVYAEDPLQQDWDEIVKRLVFAINNSQDTTWKETPFNLVHGWDAQSTLKAMASSLKRGFEKAYLPRPRVNENSEDNPEDAEDTSTPVDESPKSLFEPGDRVWLYMEIVRPGLTKKLAHRWHGPFRVKKKVEEYAYELELPDRSGYRFYPVVHVSRLKAVKEFGDRPKVRLIREVTDEARLDFDEELLHEDSWEPDMLAGEYELESILDDRQPMETSTRRSVREFLVKWAGYDEPTWEPMTNLSCGGLHYDFLREKRSSQRFQMIQVADED
ncbi:unnamed protein product [Phytophthora fragariaefolia]|uniref:Unnamed protein product n=1 Tax=Phytophthora fragariaefolia TaxID=1490495 RepID=A0A9W7CZF2_9STRA|nr:unnamed protein product [Phytophthora fragariaefolia]